MKSITKNRPIYQKGPILTKTIFYCKKRESRSFTKHESSQIGALMFVFLIAIAFILTAIAGAYILAYLYVIGWILVGIIVLIMICLIPAYLVWMPILKDTDVAGIPALITAIVAAIFLANYFKDTPTEKWWMAKIPGSGYENTGTPTEFQRREEQIDQWEKIQGSRACKGRTNKVSFTAHDQWTRRVSGLHCICGHDNTKCYDDEICVSVTTDYIEKRGVCLSKGWHTERETWITLSSP